MKLGLVTYNLARNWDLETLIKVCETVGLEGVDLRTTHKHGVEPSLSPQERERVRKRFEQTQVKLVGLGAVCEFHSPDPNEVRRNIDEAKSFVVLAHDVGAVGVRVRPNALPAGVPKEKTIKQIGESLREVGEFAQGFGVEVWLEVHGPGTSNLEVIKAIMEVANHQQVWVCWNSNREDVVDGSVKPTFSLVQNWIRHVHINDLWREDYPWRELFALLKQSGYERFTMIELSYDMSTPEDAVKLLRYYKALWRELTSPSIDGQAKR
ncbi:MAG: sugar phosphate isomerase/epimerase [Armatimonadetes bacterium]|nr:sugar phosphate isomerase/epimerase [Armatimonadota bacterium]MDW8027169.1 sugar phosphate isomerase/epimerase family protein [Armatimonadota bacterium]